MFGKLLEFIKKIIHREKTNEIYYIGGSEVLPSPLGFEEEVLYTSMLGTKDEKEAKNVLIEHNLRLVVYIARRFENTGGKYRRFNFHRNNRSYKGDKYI